MCITLLTPIVTYLVKHHFSTRLVNVLSAATLLAAWLQTDIDWGFPKRYNMTFYLKVYQRYKISKLGVPENTIFAK